MDAPTTTPLEAILEGEAKITLGDRAKEAIRREQITALSHAQARVEAAFLDLGYFTEPSARGELEELRMALDEADAAAAALWYLAPSGDES